MIHIVRLLVNHKHPHTKHNKIYPICDQMTQKNSTYAYHRH